jgi:hypothetical protein
LNFELVSARLRDGICIQEAEQTPDEQPPSITTVL